MRCACNDGTDAQHALADLPTLVMNPPLREIAGILAQLNRVILGKEAQIRLCLACLLARGHLLIEDVPGVGKTTLAHALAKTLGLSFQRVQFTSDLLPADVLGVSIYDRETGQFRFQRGPIFAQLVLADEINRASPKAQSALLEAMEEHQVTLDGQSMPLPEPFFVIATQNPQDQVGTFPLPESQLDRFLMRVQLGYPAAIAERELLSGIDRRDLVNSLESVAGVDTLATLQHRVLEVHVSPALLDYVQALVAHTRNTTSLTGLSPRAAIGLLRAARAWALVTGRDAVIPEHVQEVFGSVVEHRMRQRESGPAAVSRVLEAVPIP
jgi:MoxR-like ATPase